MRKERTPETIRRSKRALEKLRESETKYRKLFDNANDAIFLIKEESLLDCNQKFLELFGCTRDEAIGQSPARFSPPFQPDGKISKEKASEIEKAAISGTPQFFQWRHCRNDGTVFDAEVSLSHIEIDKNIRLLQAIVRDVSKRKELESALRASEKRYQILIDSTSEGVFLKDQWLRYVIVNEQFRRFFTNKKSEIIGRTVYDLLPAHIADEIGRADTKALESSSMVIREQAMYERVYEIRTFPVRLEDNTRGVGGFVIDITERKKVEEGLKAKSINLEEVNAALRVLLKQREQDRSEMEDKILGNLKSIVLPYLEKLKMGKLDEEQRFYLDTLETNLGNIASDFVQKLIRTYSNFTPTEIKVASLLRNGMTVKEIAKMSGVSDNAIHHHRQNVRNKLGLTRQKINLKTYLMSLD